MPTAAKATAPSVTQQFGPEPATMAEQEYNFEHFRAKHLLADIARTLLKKGIRPGQPAPDFELPRVGGGTFRLSRHRGVPVLLHFGSYS